MWNLAHVGDGDIPAGLRTDSFSVEAELGLCDLRSEALLRKSIRFVAAPHR